MPEQSMPLEQILKMPEGFTPPQVTVKLEKIYEYKSGVGDNGPWSFQTVQTDGGRLKLKGLNELPKNREGMTVTLRANQSKQHGLTGMKVSHEQYNGKTYDQLVITSSCRWEFAEPSKNGHALVQSAPQGLLELPAYIDHLMSVAALTSRITTVLGIEDPAATQACFATLCIDTKNRGVVLPKVLPQITVSERSTDSDPFGDAPPPQEPDDDDGEVPF